MAEHVRRHSICHNTNTRRHAAFLCSSVSDVCVTMVSDSKARVDAEDSDFGLQYKHGVAYRGTTFTLNSIILRPLSLVLSLCKTCRRTDKIGAQYDRFVHTSRIRRMKTKFQIHINNVEDQLHATIIYLLTYSMEQSPS